MPYSNTEQRYAAYKAANQTTENKTQQIVMLYDGLMRYVHQAKLAIESKDIQERFDVLEKAGQIIAGLQASIDFENGEKIAVILDGYYNTIYTKIHIINRENTIESCDDLIEDIKGMRGAWQDVYEETSPKEKAANSNIASSGASETPESPSSSLQVSV